MKMKMVKKLVAMALVSTMTLSGLAACGGETADTNKDTSKDTAKEDKQLLSKAVTEKKSGTRLQQRLKKKRALTQN